MYTEIAIVHNTHNIVITGSKEVSSIEQLMYISTCQAGQAGGRPNNKHNKCVPASAGKGATQSGIAC